MVSTAAKTGSDIGTEYDPRYEINPATGESSYSSKFGPFRVSAAHILEITSLLRQALAEKYSEFFDFSQEKLVSDKEISKSLARILASGKHPEPALAYNFLIRQIFSPRLKRLNLGKDIILNLLDLGCGDGRYLQFYIELAEVLKEYGVALSVCFNDLSSKALETIRVKGKSLGFVNDNIDQDRFILKNLSFKTVHTNDPSNPRVTKTLLAAEMLKDCQWRRNCVRAFGDGREAGFNVSIAIYGVFANMPSVEMRRPVLKMLYDLTSTAIMLDLPTAKFLDTFAGGKPLKILEVDKENGVAKYLLDKSHLKYALFGREDDKGRIKTNDMDAEIRAALISDNLLLTATSFRFVGTVPMFYSYSFRDWQKDFALSSATKTERSQVEYTMITIYPNKARNIEANRGSSR